MMYMDPSIIPQAMLQPTAVTRSWRTPSLPDFADKLAVRVTVNTMISPKRTSPSRLAGSRCCWTKVFLSRRWLCPVGLLTEDPCPPEGWADPAASLLMPAGVAVGNPFVKLALAVRHHQIGRLARRAGQLRSALERAIGNQNRKGRFTM